MELPQALSIIKQACSSVVGDLRTHEQIQAAIHTVEQALDPPAKAAKKEKKS